MSFNITTKVLPTPPPQQQQQHDNNEKDETVNNNKPIPTSVGPQKPAGPILNNDSSSDSDSDDSDDDKNNKPAQQSIGPPKPTIITSKTIATTSIGPPRPTLNCNNDDSSSDSDSDDGDKQTKKSTTSQSIGPPKPTLNSNDSEDSDSDSDSDDSDSEDDEKEEIERWKTLAASLPISHEVTIKGHQRTVSSISIDSSGSRMLTGSYDCKVKFWDFNGMDSSFKSFREIEPNEGAQVRSVQFNNTSGNDMFLTLPYTTQIRLYDRDGHFKDESISGDRFIQDLYHTKGHVSTLTGACWHPSERDEMISSSIDGTIRLWDINSLKKNKSVIKSKSTKGTRIGVINCTYDQRGDIITGALADGSISMWDKRQSLLKPKHTILDAHEINTMVTSVAYNRDCYSMISRGMDNSLKVWDLRALTKPTASWDDLLNDYQETNCIFGSFDRVIVTGTSCAKGGFGTIVIYDLSSLTKMRQIRVENDVSVVNSVWNTKLNQLFFGCSDSNIRGFYDPTNSVNGLKLCVSKAPRVKNAADFEPDRPIITPNTLPLFRQVNQKKESKKNKLKNKPSSSETLQEKAVSKGPNLTQHLIQNIGLVNNISWKEDARESFIRMDKGKQQQQSTDNNDNDNDSSNNQK